MCEMRRLLQIVRWGLISGQLLIVAVSLYQSAITALGYRRWRAGITPPAPYSAAIAL